VNRLGTIFVIAILLASSGTAYGAVSDGTVMSFQKISETEGNFGGVLGVDHNFGGSITSLGDLDGDGVTDLAVGAHDDDVTGNQQGSVWILFLNSDGTVKDQQNISSVDGGFGAGLNDGDFFGTSVANLGDLDGDGVIDLAVGAVGDDDGGGLGTNSGAVWILFMNSDGTVKHKQKISNSDGGFVGGTLTVFGASIANMGDLDGDGVIDLAVGEYLDDDGGNQRGAVWILFMKTDGTVKDQQKISDLAGGFGGTLDDEDLFGWGAGNIGDLDNDGVTDLGVGARNDDDGGFNRGALWILFMNSDGTVKDEQKISDLEGGFLGTLNDQEWFGASVANLGDLDGDNVQDLVLGGPNDGGFNLQEGAVWILFMKNDGTVKSFQKISDTEGGFDGIISTSDLFGFAVANIGDLDGNGINDIAVGAENDDRVNEPEFFNSGAVWILFLKKTGEIPDDIVGGKLIPIESTSLLLAAAQSFSWMIPVVLSVLGIGLFVVTRKSENS